MGYQRSRQTSTVATLEITPSFHGNSRTSSKRGRTLMDDSLADKENSAASMPESRGYQRRYSYRSKAALSNPLILGNNGASHSKSRKSPRTGKRVKCPGSIPAEEAAARKRSCQQIMDSGAEEAPQNAGEKMSDGSPESHSVAAAGETALADLLANNCNGQDLELELEQDFEKDGRVLGLRDEGFAHASATAVPLNDRNNGTPAELARVEARSTEGPVDHQSSASVIAKVQEIYSKLHMKYKRLKERKFGEFEEYFREQNKNLAAYIQANEELLEHVRSKNNWFKFHADQEKITMTLNRLMFLEQENMQCQTNLLVQHRKNVELTNEVNRLQSLLSDHMDVRKKIKNFSMLCQSCKANCFETTGQFSLPRDVCNENQAGNLVPYYVGLESNSTLQDSMVQTEGLHSCQTCGHNNRVGIGNQERRLICGETSQAADNNVQVPLQVEMVKSISCGDRQPGKNVQNVQGTDIAAEDVNILVRVLLQCMVGFKITIVDEGKLPTLIFLHQSSGYSFQLMPQQYANNLSEDGELVYQVVSLGTLHKVAPDWMKEDIIFNIGQVDVFFDRLLQVTNGRGYNLWMRGR